MTDLRDPGDAAGPATVVTLARRLGVAPSTVSRALRGDTRISVALRQRVNALAEAVGYTTNAFARTLSSGRSGLIGLALGSIDNPFYAELLEHAVFQAAERGLRFLLLHAGAGPLEDRTAEALLQYQVDGCLFTSAELSSRAAAVCAARGVPVVMVNRVPRQHASAVSCNNAAGGADLAAFLIAGGHARMALVRGTPDSSTATDREAGFVRALALAGLAPPMLLDGSTSHAGGFAAGQVVAALPARQRPDAVFAVSDIAAMGVIDALRLAGIRVPEDISVVGFDGITPASRPPYELTTVAQPLRAMVTRGLDMLMARITDPSVPDEVVQQRGELVVRRSARRPPADPVA